MVCIPKVRRLGPRGMAFCGKCARTTMQDEASQPTPSSATLLASSRICRMWKMGFFECTSCKNRSTRLGTSSSLMPCFRRLSLRSLGSSPLRCADCRLPTRRSCDSKSRGHFPPKIGHVRTQSADANAVGTSKQSIEHGWDKLSDSALSRRIWEFSAAVAASGNKALC